MRIIVLNRFKYKNKARIEGETVTIDDSVEANNLIKFGYAKLDETSSEAKTTKPKEVK